MTDGSQQHQCATRRCVLLGAGVLGVAGVLTACSTTAVPYDDDHDSGAGEAGTMTSTAGSGMAAQPSASASAMNGGSMNQASGKMTGTLLGSASEVPVGGGMAFTAAKVVVTQPAKGVYKAFSAICTHVGCICNEVADGTINCPCHGAKFKITDGSAVAGPTTVPLPPKTVSVTDGKIYLT
jgi:Rieske Fe-S protein